jgi:TolB-like protein
LPGPDIFLSYNREDQASARRFAEAFEAEGISVWWDVTLRSGEAYDQVTEEALRTAKAVVVLWSPRSVVSRWVRAEATLADRNRTLVPARIGTCDLPIMFELTQTADLSHWQGEARDPTWKAFLADVRKLVGAKAAPDWPSIGVVSPQPTRERKPSIAVLPFINRSGVAGDDVFADGMVEDLTAALSLSKRMKVIAASATAAYRTGARDLRQIGHELGVRYLLEGNVRRVGDDFRVTAQLVESEGGDIVWTQKFDRPLAEVARLQEELVMEVAACLGAQVHRSEIEHALRKPGDISAWEALLRAEANVSRHSVAGYEAAIEDAQRAIAIDPEYDLAHATLAMAYGTLREISGRDDPQLVSCLLEAVEAARRLDSSDPIVLARIGVALHAAGCSQEGLPFAERAVSINPNLENAHIGLAAIYVALGRYEDAVRETETAMGLAPNGIWFSASLQMQATAYFQTGRFDVSLALVERVLRLSPYVPAQILRVACLTFLERRNEAVMEVKSFRRSNPNLSDAFVEKIFRGVLCIGLEKARTETLSTSLMEIWNEGAH